MTVPWDGLFYQTYSNSGVTKLVKKAAEMLLNGATLMGDPCPYCRGVRVMYNGHALCVDCGREPQDRAEPPKEQDRAEPSGEQAKKEPVLESLQKKLVSLSSELEAEADHGKQQEILKSIASLLDVMAKMNSS